jgi:catechol 2,3-dioxygenase-like lactoylglutathione lyase family enzyme
MSSAPPIRQLEHWTLVSTDIEKTKRFYTEVLGAKPPTGRPADGPACVDLAGTLIDFFPASDAWVPSPGSGGQHHAYIIDLEAFDLWVEHFKANSVPARLTTHGMNRMSIYVDDPDGYHIELSVVFADAETARREIEKRRLEVSWFQMNPSGARA